jgi:hypothetical protein
MVTSICSDTPRLRPAPIRRAPLRVIREITSNQLPPTILKLENFVLRNDTDLSKYYAPDAQRFIKLDDEFIAHITRCAPYKRLPRAWGFGDEVNTSLLWTPDGLCLIIRECNQGWLMERGGRCSMDKNLLANPLLDAPLLCPTAPTAARLAMAMGSNPDGCGEAMWCYFGTTRPLC